MTFNELQKANDSLKKMDIKGKEYVSVNERVKAFRMLYPEGKIITELIKYEDGVVIFKAEVYRVEQGTDSGDGWEYGDILATGYAKEVEGSTNINRFSALENCETSAVGRALGFLGIGIDTSIASFEEVTNAKLNEDGNQLATPTEKAGLIATIRSRCTEDNLTAEEINEKVRTMTEEMLRLVGFDGAKQPEGMTAKQYAKAMQILNGGI